MIVYDSFSKQYKTPFGPTLAAQPHHFWIQVAATLHPQKVWLQVYRDGAWTRPTASIALVATDRGYTGEFKPQAPGLYFYFFEIQTTTRTLYYGCCDGGYGGIGQVYDTRAQVQMYQLTCLRSVDQVPKWYREAVFYHIFVDRFNNGNANGLVNAPKPNSFIYGTTQDLPYYVKDAAGDIVRWDFYGGNLKGIEAKLPYLQQLGITALYLSPIFEARSNHRYDTGDYLQLDGMLGTLADFKHFLKAVHEKGMHVILDGVFNHVGADSRYFNRDHHYDSVGAAEAPTSPYYDWFTFKHYPETYASWWGVSDLPAIKKQSKSFQKFITAGPRSVIGYWTALGVDGWRLDVADELTDTFIFKIRQALAQFKDKVLIGEVWEDASHKISYGHRRHYIEGGGLQAVMNYPLRQLLLDLVTGAISSKTFVTHILTLRQNYAATVFDYNFNNIGTHDTVRLWTALNGNLAQIQLVWQLFLTLPGVPCIYYGDEAGLAGGVDPDNRRFFPWGHENKMLQDFVRQWLQQRRQNPVFKGEASFDLCYGTHWLGYVRQFQKRQCLCLVNPTAKSVALEARTVLAALPTDQLQPAVQQQLKGVKLKPYEFLILDSAKL